MGRPCRSRSSPHELELWDPVAGGDVLERRAPSAVRAGERVAEGERWVVEGDMAKRSPESLSMAAAVHLSVHGHGLRRSPSELPSTTFSHRPSLLRCSAFKQEEASGGDRDDSSASPKCRKKGLSMAAVVHLFVHGRDLRRSPSKLPSTTSSHRPSLLRCRAFKQEEAGGGDRDDPSASPKRKKKGPLYKLKAAIQGLAGSQSAAAEVYGGEYQYQRAVEKAEGIPVGPLLSPVREKRKRRDDMWAPLMVTTKSDDVVPHLQKLPQKSATSAKTTQKTTEGCKADTAEEPKNSSRLISITSSSVAASKS